MSSVPPDGQGTPGSEKVRLCTICKQPRLGHPRSGCPNAIIIPITPTPSSTPGPTVHLHATLAPSATAPAPQYQPSAPSGDYGTRSASAKPTPIELNRAQAHWDRTWAFPTVPHVPSPTFDAGPSQPAQFPTNAEWQLVLMGRRDETTGQWVVATRDTSGAFPTMHSPQNAPSIPPITNTPSGVPHYYNSISNIVSTQNAPAHTHTIATASVPRSGSEGVFKLILAALLGAVIGLYSLTWF